MKSTHNLGTSIVCETRAREIIMLSENGALIPPRRCKYKKIIEESRALALQYSTIYETNRPHTAEYPSVLEIPDSRRKPRLT